MKLIDKLPYFYDNGYTRPIIEAEQVEADILYREIAETLKQCFISTATWGLDYWEDMLFLPRGTGKSYDERRSIIYTRMRATRTTTVEVVKELASSFFGAENVNNATLLYLFAILIIIYLSFIYCIVLSSNAIISTYVSIVNR